MLKRFTPTVEWIGGDCDEPHATMEEDSQGIWYFSGQVIALEKQVITLEEENADLRSQVDVLKKLIDSDGGQRYDES